MDKNTFYITTPIYYVNDKPHIGHAYTTILADVLARYHRLLDHDTFFLTGTDEHGQKVQQAAEKAGISSQEQADTTVIRFQELWRELGMTHDDFIRTTEDRHKTVVQDILQDLYDRGEIYRADYDGWYDVTSETFVTATELEDIDTENPPPHITRIQESNYFFRMSHYQEWLIQYIQDHPEFIQPDFRRNETLGFLKKELTDLCISRPKSRLSWGIELPFDSDFVTYVWFDALVNYISAVGYLKDEERFKRWWPVSCHLIGKDILTTHTVYWPTMLKAMGVEMPQTIFAHGWWLSGESKMSKSLGNVVNPMDMIGKYGVDAFRYYLIAEMTLGQDASFTEENFAKRYNSDLANDLGNLLSRVLSMIAKNCDGVMPSVPEGVLEPPEEKELWAITQKAVSYLTDCIGTMRLDRGLGEIMTAVRATNRYLEQKQPWHQAKEEDKTPLHITLYTAAEVLRVCAGLFYPVMPEKMGLLRVSLGLSADPPNLDRLKDWGVVPSGAPIERSAPLFPKIIFEADAPEPEEAPKDAKPAKQKKKKERELIAYEDFAKVELRTAKILSAEKVEGADKLLRLEVEVGDEKRQLVAGIAQHYDPQDLPGKTVVVVANLEPAKIRGVDSQGMLLAATDAKTLKLVTVEDCSSGAPIK